VQPKCRNSNKKLPVRTYVCIGTMWYSRIFNNLAPVQCLASQINGIFLFVQYMPTLSRVILALLKAC
jgi:hypothetical protein